MTPPPPNPDPHILIVEDEPRMREMLLRAVGSWGLPADAAHSAEEALRLLETNPCNILILDLNLPGMGGLEFCQIVRQRRPQAQVIILTGFGDLESARRAIHLDVVEFLTKPCHLGELERAIDRATRRLPAPQPQPVQLPPAPEPPTARTGVSSPPAQSPESAGPATLDDLERQHILAALARHNGNRAATAAELGISLRTLYYRLSEYQRQGYSVD
jgi:DNA-binding NtrC family response regulator